ncbi:NAD(P)/FAD-dependent oxidoreductase [Amycolatopsis regifaucium]|uniref:Oxidoreductase n=1 Tax=Amycolatopsis regifaucium TaxID=546365 RepID=A0A154MVH1_9PSEU|nr:NAD(P)/FAD-dependent oxidoreductase [Amycolatopsis regifaucium]KZB88272.1 oxidoreductase [Amycolatopsis regifaucium]OKA11385.1 oxidoreductase [Amycolatopsis regifaucium]SFH43119.1 Flavin containing amine oxidoreductase [Amycolatopsis regifaucium]
MAGHETDVVIVGAGLAGLAAGLHLHRAGIACAVLEAGDEVGGRVRTDVVDGFRLDRGFQILNPAYPAIQRLTDVDALRLGRFWRAVRVSDDARTSLLGNPLDTPKALRDVAARRYLSAKDLAALGALTARVAAGPARSIIRGDDSTTADELRRTGLSDRAVDTVLRPFLSGVFLEAGLSTSSRFFRLVWRSFLRSAPSLPALGMGELPRQLARLLPVSAVRTGCPVEEVEGGRVRTSGGDVWNARAVVVATDGTTAARLVGGVPEPRWNSVTTWYFTPPRSPLREPVIVIDARGGPILSTAVLSEVCPTYAPDGAALVSTSALTPLEEAEVRRELSRMYRDDASRWPLAGRYEIPHALPDMTAPHDIRREIRFGERIYVCGDHRDTSSLQGALASGARTARAVARDLRAG